MEIIEMLVANDQLLAAIMALFYNLAGYVMSILQVQAVEKYQVAKLAETLVLFETLFTILSTVGGLKVEYTLVITLVVAVLRSVGAKLKEYTAAVKNAV